MKQKNKLEDFFNEYSQRYLSLSNLQKYNCYHLLFLRLDYFLKTQDIFKNILLVHQQPNDIDYSTILSEDNKKVNLFMTGIKFEKFQRSFYFKRVTNPYQNYEFNSFCYQPKFDKEDWKETKERFDKIDLIIIPSKVVDITKKTTFLSDKKFVKFLKKFSKAKVFAIGFDFSLTNKNTKKLTKLGIKFDNFLSIKANEHIGPEREEI